MTPADTTTSALFQQLARVGRAVASPPRLELLHLLAHGEQPVEALAAETNLGLKNASAHLRVLREARLVETRKEGQYVHYRLADEGVGDFVLALRELAERRLAEAREASGRLLDGRDGVTPMDRRRLLSRVRAGQVTVLDLRAPGEFAAGHIPGARSISLAELRRTLRSIPRDQEVVAYCHGVHCVLSLEAVHLLRSRGYEARRLEEGFAEWEAAGLPVERAEARA